MITFACDWYGIHTSKKTAAVFKGHDDGAVEVVDAITKKLLLQSTVVDFEVSSRLGNTPRYLTLATGEKIETSDNEAVDQWLKLAHPKRGFSLIHMFESRWRFVALSLVLVICVLWGTVRFGVPAVSKTIAFTLPAKTLDQASQQTLNFLDSRFFEESNLDAERQQELQALFYRAISQHPDYDIHVEFRSSENIGANAFALPDGTIIFTDRMVELAEHDEELLAVLGHEIAHVIYRHSLRRVIQNSLYVFILALITGDTSGTTEILLSAPLVFAELAYSRQNELEADAYSKEWMLKNGIPLHRFADIMRRVVGSAGAELEESEGQKVKQGSWTKYLSTHPDLARRLEAFESQ